MNVGQLKKFLETLPEDMQLMKRGDTAADEAYEPYEKIRAVQVTWDGDWSFLLID